MTLSRVKDYRAPISNRSTVRLGALTPFSRKRSGGCSVDFLGRDTGRYLARCRKIGRCGALEDLRTKSRANPSLKHLPVGVQAIELSTGGMGAIKKIRDQPHAPPPKHVQAAADRCSASCFNARPFGRGEDVSSDRSSPHWPGGTGISNLRPLDPMDLCVRTRTVSGT